MYLYICVYIYILDLWMNSILLVKWPYGSIHSYFINSYFEKKKKSQLQMCKENITLPINNIDGPMWSIYIREQQKHPLWRIVDL